MYVNETTKREHIYDAQVLVRLLPLHVKEAFATTPSASVAGAALGHNSCDSTTTCSGQHTGWAAHSMGSGAKTAQQLAQKAKTAPGGAHVCAQGDASEGDSLVSGQHERLCVLSCDLSQTARNSALSEALLWTSPGGRVPVRSLWAKLPMPSAD